MTIVRSAPAGPARALTPARPDPGQWRFPQFQAGRPPARRGVPGRIRRLTSVTAAALALFFGALALGAADARDGLEVIGRDAGPQVVATAGLYFGLSDMDAQVADALLMGGQYGERRRSALPARPRQPREPTANRSSAAASRALRRVRTHRG